MIKKPFLKLITPVIGLITAFILGISLVLPSLIRQHVERNALMFSQNRAEQFKILRRYYTQNVISKILRDGHLKPAVNHKENSDRVPLPATMIHDLSVLMEGSGLTIKLHSPFPFPNRASRELGAFEQQAWKHLTQNPTTPYYQTETIGSSTVVRVGVADLMVGKACVECHNTHPDSPKTNWKLGDVRGVLEINVPIDNQLLWAKQLSDNLLIILAGILVFICLAMYFIYNWTIGAKLTALLNELSDQKFAMDQHSIIAITDVIGTITYVNQKFCKISGYSKSEILGQNYRTLNLSNQPNSYWKSMLNTLVHGGIWHDEVRSITKDGKDYWVDTTIVPFMNKKGKPTRYISIQTDITRIKQIEKTLHESEERFRILYDYSPDLYVSVSAEDGCILLCNKTFLKVSGYARDEIIGKHIFELYSEESIPKAKAMFQQFLNTGRVRDEELTLKLKDGSELDVSLNVDAVKNKSGKILYSLSSWRDITERKHNDVALRLSEERFRRMANSSPVMVWITDTAGSPTFVNQSWLDYTGLDMEQASIHENWLDLIHSDDKKTAFLEYYQQNKNHKSITTEYRLRNAKGEMRWILDKGVPLYDEKGVFNGYMGSAIDITDRKQNELETRIAAIAFESQQPMVITDVNDTILRFNKAFSETTGYSEEEAIGQSISILKSGRHDADFYTQMWNELLTNGRWEGEIWDRRKNGEIYPKWLFITAVRQNAGKVTHYVATHTDITERKEAEEKIKQLAFYDSLTQIPNRRLLQERLNQSINLAQRGSGQIALLMLDLDRFKSVNDSLGHLAGDKLLQQVAQRITAQLRKIDTVARLGGDEFVVLLEDISQLNNAGLIAEAIITNLSKPFNLSENECIQIGVSIGISLYPEHGNSVEELMDHADAALYQAKDAGRGCFAYFSEELTLAVLQRINIENRLRRAIDLDEFCVFFQPQVDIVTGNIIGAEALIRWQDPEDGLIAPSHFIPIAEESGLIVEIGSWVLRETCQQGRHWLDEGRASLTLAVNVSAHQIQRSGFCSFVAKVLEETGFPAESLELEITESGLMGHKMNVDVVSILNNLRGQGIRLAIDDFGTGYSSLAYLKNFPLDVLKIDKVFIDGIPFNRDDMEIAATIIAMGHILGFQVLAEGVETAEQLAFLREKGCDSFQGYIRSKPLSIPEFVKYFHE